jgi:hypothetical protein
MVPGLIVALIVVCLALAVGSIWGKVPGWAVDFAIIVTMMVAFWPK